MFPSERKHSSITIAEGETPQQIAGSPKFHWIYSNAANSHSSQKRKI